MARMCELTTPLGDALQFSHMRVSEGMSRLFEIQLHAVSTRADINPNDLLGQKVSVKVTFDEGVERFFSGYVRRFGFGGHEGRFYEYRMEVVPWLWFLTRTSDCRIFQDKSVPEILDAVFEDEDTTKLAFRLADRSGYATGEYWVQYRETDFNFVSRLMEQEGIYYFFEHDDGVHRAVVLDSKSSHEPIAGEANILYLPPNPQQNQPQDVVNSFNLHQEIQPGRYMLQEYDFKKPGNDMRVQSRPEIEIEHAKPAYEMYDYPGDYDAHADGENYVGARMEELSTQSLVFSGSGMLRRFHVGRRFKLSGHSREDHNTDYLILTTDYEFIDPPFESGGTASSYTCRFTAIRAAQQYRPPRVTPRPLIHGIQSALVTGPAGEEIHTDEYGRIKVQFHWDRDGKKDEKTSCWLRVAFLAAGARWGFVSIPRIGHEVIVSFLEGDPDRPLVTGVVYNGANMPPWELPANKTQSGMLSRSTLKGGAANANALRFEDKKGAEQVWLHAEKNQDIEVENDESHWVGHDRTKVIDHDEQVHVKHDRTERVDNNESISIGNDRTETVGHDQSETIMHNKLNHVVGDHTEMIDKSMSIIVASSLTEMVGTAYTETVGGAMTITVGGAMAVTVGAALAETIAGAKTESVGSSKTESIGGSKAVSIAKDATEAITGNQTLTVKKNVKHAIEGEQLVEVAKNASLKAKKVQITADDEISLKTGSAEILMKKNGDITIKGNKITVKGDGDVIIKGSKIAEN